MIYEVIKLDGKHEFVEKPEKLRFTCDELIQMLGGWFALRWAYSEEGEDSNGNKIETDYWVCSWDAQAGDGENALQSTKKRKHTCTWRTQSTVLPLLHPAAASKHPRKALISIKQVPRMR